MSDRARRQRSCAAEDKGHAGGGQPLAQALFQICFQRIKGFVQHQNLRAAQEAAGDHQAAQLPAAEAGACRREHQRKAAARGQHRPQLHRFERSHQVSISQAALAEPQIVRHGACERRQGPVFMQNEAGPLCRCSADGGAVQRYVCARHQLKSGDGAQQTRLAAAGRSRHGQRFTGPEDKGFLVKAQCQFGGGRTRQDFGCLRACAVRQVAQGGSQGAQLRQRRSKPAQLSGLPVQGGGEKRQPQDTACRGTLKPVDRGGPKRNQKQQRLQGVESCGSAARLLRLIKADRMGTGKAQRQLITAPAAKPCFDSGKHRWRWNGRRRLSQLFQRAFHPRQQRAPAVCHGEGQQRCAKPAEANREP